MNIIFHISKTCLYYMVKAKNLTLDNIKILSQVGKISTTIVKRLDNSMCRSR